MHGTTTGTEPDGDAEADAGNLYSSSADLARGVEQTELHLHEVSNGELAELLRMLQGWRRPDPRL